MNRHLSGLVSSSFLVAVLLSTSPAPGASFETRDERVAARQRAHEKVARSVVGTIEYDAFVTLTATEFQGFGDDSIFLDLSRFCLESLCQFFGGVRVPHGATIVGVEIDACDEDAATGNISIALTRVQNGVTAEWLSEFDAGPGCVYTYEALATPHDVDQYLDSFVLWVTASNSDVDERFVAARVYYRSGDGEVVPTGITPSLFQ